MQTRNFVLIATTLLVVLISLVLLNRGLLSGRTNGNPDASSSGTVVSSAASSSTPVNTPVPLVPTTVPTTVQTTVQTLTASSATTLSAAISSTVETSTSLTVTAIVSSSACPCPEEDSPTLEPIPTPAPDGPAPTNPAPTEDSPAVQIYTYQVLNSYPHDPDAFTQGLIWLDGVLYEGTGLRGQSSLRKVNLTDGQILQQIDLSDQYFGEGIVVWEEQIMQLTWQSRIGFVYELESFEQINTFTYPTEGWGLTHDGTQLIMSDGTPKLYFMDPETLQQTSSIDITLRGEPLQRLNELEYINGLVYANIWQTNWIAIIEPMSGQVTGMINLEGLLDVVPEPGQRIDVLNGIAYDSAEERLFVTGKLWPRLYEIELVPVPQ